MQRLDLSAWERGDEEVQRQRARMHELLQQELAAAAPRARSELLGSADGNMKRLQAAIQTEERRQDHDLDRVLAAVRGAAGA